jgi:lipopolysaccharide export system permease protein
MMPPILRNGEQLVAKGVALADGRARLVDAHAAGVSITIPMALLVGILVALGRLSADREFVALQACGVSVFRVLRPIALLAIAGTAATAYETIIALPDANQTFREITFNIVAASAETDIKPRVFFSNFPNRILYVRDMPPGGTWRDVFFADDTKADQTTGLLRQERPACSSIARSARCSSCSKTGRVTPRIPRVPTAMTAARLAP